MSEQTEALATTAVVKHYTEVLMLPFRLTSGERFSADKTSLRLTTEAFTKRATVGDWKPVASGAIPQCGVAVSAADDGGAKDWDRLQHYQALNYFHPTVRGFLFGSETNIVGAHDVANDYLQIFRHQRLKRVLVTVPVWRDGGYTDIERCFDVVRCELAFMQPDVGVLQLELRASIRNPEGWPLNVMQIVRDRLRRLYPPYFDDAGRGGHYPGRVLFLGLGGDSDVLYDSESDVAPMHQTMVDATLACEGIPKDAETSPCAGHWAWLLKPLLSAPPDVRAILPGDDRLPSMAFVAVDNPRAISRGDWVRLTYANEAGSDAVPYSRKFLRDFEQRHCYDRFWHGRKDSSESPSRIMNCGYAFTMVGSFADKCFFMNPRNGALVAFRQIYVRMGLVAHFQKTALLGATARLSALSWRNSKDGKLRPYDEREQQIMSVYQHFIEFTHVFWFDEVSPQEQGIEMFAMWQRELRSKELYDEVRQELKDLVEYVGAERAKAQQLTVERFTRTAAVLGGIGVIAGLLGMNILPFKDGKIDIDNWWEWSNAIAIVFTVLAVTVVVAVVGTHTYRRGQDRIKL